MAENKYHDEQDLRNIDLMRNISSKLPQYVTKFLRGIQQTTSTRTRLGYCRDILNFFEYICEAYTDSNIATPKDVSLEILSNIDMEFVEDYLDYLEKYQRNGRIYTNGRASIKRKMSSLSGLFNYLYKHDLISNNVMSKIDKPKLAEKQIIRMEINETADFLDTVEYGNKLTDKQLQYHNKNKVRDLALLTIMLSTGIRVSECVGLDINDVDFDNMCIKVFRKGGKEALVYFSDEASIPLLDYIKERKKIEAVSGHENALFLSSHKKRISVRAVEKMVSKYASCSVPLKHITPHKLRSTYGTALYQETGDIYLVADVLGHSDVNTTKKHYADLDNERRRSARNIVTLRENKDIQ